MLATLRKWILIALFISGAGFLLVRGVQYRLTRDVFPEGTEIAGIDVSGMDSPEARLRIEEAYSMPVYVYHKSEHVEIDPVDVGFVLEVDAMLTEAQQRIAERNEWLRYAGFVLHRPLEPVTIPLIASNNEEEVAALVQSISELLDEPATPAQVLSEGGGLKEGQGGFVTDVDASVPIVTDALYRQENRVAKLVVLEQEEPEITIDLLAETIESKLQSFDGIGSVFILDLQTGEEVNINSDMAMSGLSILKIGIFVEAYRAIDDVPNAEEQKLFLDTATRSSNYGANLLLHVVAGVNNTYKGADIFTESMQRLGLENTFMAVPYDASPPAYRKTTYVTPANSRPDVELELDETMQSTAEEIGTLLAMIYRCSKGGGALLAVYPDELTPVECQAIIDLMVLNEEGNLIRYGVPEGIPVSHKHGWAQGTHADAGIVYSPGGDFVIVEYLHQAGGWLVAEESFPILREIARAAYNYFNMDDPYLPAEFLTRSSINPDDPFSELGNRALQENETTEDGTIDDNPLLETGDDASAGS